MQLKEIPILFTFNSDYLLPALIAIKSLIDSANADTYYNIHILFGSLTKKERALVENLCLQDNLQKCSINWIKVSKNEMKNAPVTDKWPSIVYYRLLASKYITNIDKIIYSDVDVLFRGDLSYIYSVNLSGYQLGGVVAEYSKNPICHKYYPENNHKYIFMSGFMLMNLKLMREEEVVNSYYNAIKKFSGRLQMFDLEIINLASRRIKKIPLNYCVLENIYDSDVDYRKTYEYSWLTKYYTHKEIVEARRNPIIIHYAGKAVKVWKRPISKILYPYRDYIKSFSHDYIVLNNTTWIKYYFELSVLPLIFNAIFPCRTIDIIQISFRTMLHKLVMLFPSSVRNRVKRIIF